MSKTTMISTAVVFVILGLGVVLSRPVAAAEAGIVESYATEGESPGG